MIMHAILQQYDWLGMRADITKWVSALFLHISVEIMEIFTYFIYVWFEFKVSEPFELVGFDLAGKLKCSNNGHTYIYKYGALKQILTGPKNLSTK